MRIILSSLVFIAFANLANAETTFTHQEGCVIKDGIEVCATWMTYEEYLNMKAKEDREAREKRDENVSQRSY